MRKNGELVPTSTLFLTFDSPEFLKEIKVGYLRVKVELFVPNPLKCFNCNRFGLAIQTLDARQQSVSDVQKRSKHDGECDGPPTCPICSGPHAASAKNCPVWQTEKEIQRVRVEKRIFSKKPDNW